jgi:fucose permease
LIFMSNAIGYISAAFFIDAIRAKFGRSKTHMIAQVLIISGYICIVSAGGHSNLFPLVVASFFLLGCGMSINLAMGNTFAVNLRNGNQMMGAMHGSYGLGGTVGPLVATAMITKGHIGWSKFYILVLGIAVFCLFAVGWSFWNYEGLVPSEPSIDAQRTSSHNQASVTARKPGQMKQMLKVLKYRTVLVGALFIFAYQGAEVSISGWVISFLLTTRGGDPSAVGYVTSGFWGGITIGRFLLPVFAHKVGEKRFVYVLIILAAVFQLLVWLVPNIVGDAVAVSIVGLLLGPIYPTATVVFTRLIGRSEQVNALGVISAFGSSGGAVAPFVTGLSAQAAGTFVLHPIALTLFGIMLACWFGLPSLKKRAE